MPDFRLIVGPGIDTVAWSDPPSGARPSRLNAVREQAPLHYSVVGVIDVQAVVGGTVGPPDSLLGGRLFSATFVELPGVPPPITLVGGRSAWMRFAPIDIGHYTLRIDRSLGGGIFLHFDVLSTVGGS